MCDPCLSTGFEKGLQLTIRNTTDHPIDLSTSAPVRVTVVCATNMTADGHLTAPLPAFPTETPFTNDMFVDRAPSSDSPLYDTPGTGLAPGAEAANGTHRGYGVESIAPGTETCEGAIVTTSDGTWKFDTLSVVARLTNIPVYTFEVVAPPPTTTRPSTTSTPPEPTTTSTT